MIGAIYYTSASYSFGLPAPVGDSCDNDHLLDISFESDDTLEPSLRKLDLMSCLLLFHFLGRPPGKSIWAVSYLMFLTHTIINTIAMIMIITITANATAAEAMMTTLAAVGSGGKKNNHHKIGSIREKFMLLHYMYN